MGDGWGINADYTAHFESRAGESRVDLVTESHKYCVNTHFALLCAQFFQDVIVLSGYF